MFLMNGFQLRGIIRGFDGFPVILDSEGKQQMIYKHAISTVVPAKPVALEPESWCAAPAGGWSSLQRPSCQTQFDAFPVCRDCRFRHAHKRSCRKAARLHKFRPAFLCPRQRRAAIPHPSDKV